jgi:hypothetical protein
VQDGTPSAAPVEQAQPAIEQGSEPANLELETEIEVGENPVPGENLEEDEYEEFDWEGKKVKAPKGLKDGVLRQADYTRKTQEVSAKAKELAAREERISEQFKASEEELNLRVGLRQINAQLDQYQKYTAQQWQELKASNPDGYNEHRFHWQALKDAKRESEGKISEAETRRTHEMQTVVSKRLEETQAHAQKIKGWSPDMDKQVVEYAVGKGLNMDEVSRLMSPGFYDAMRFAKIGEALLKKQASAPNLPNPGTAPLDTVGAKSNPSARIDLAKADMESYVAARRAQEEARRKR